MVNHISSAVEVACYFAGVAPVFASVGAGAGAGAGVAAGAGVVGAGAFETGAVEAEPGCVPPAWPGGVLVFALGRVLCSASFPFSLLALLAGPWFCALIQRNTQKTTSKTTETAICMPLLCFLSQATAARIYIPPNSLV